MTSLLTYDQVPEIPREWLWPGFLAYGETTMFAAEGGTGKGTVLARLAALVTNGDPFPGQAVTERRDPRTVLVISPEDDRNKDMRGRLEAAGADLRYVVDLTEHEDGRLWTLADVPKLGRLILAINDPASDYPSMPAVGLVTMDPLTKLLGPKQNISSRLAANDVIGGIQALARGTDTPVGLTQHLNWDGGINGSRALLDSLKLVFRIDRDKEIPDQRIITSVKSNITDGSGIKYRVTLSESGYPVATFIDAGEVRDELTGAAQARAAMAAVVTPAESASVPHRTACLVDRPGVPEPERSILGESGSMPAARRLAQDSAYGYGVKLVWETRPDGMQTAARILPGGGTVKFAAYPVAA